MLLKVTQLHVVNPDKEIGKERLPVEVVEQPLFIDPEMIVSVSEYCNHLHSDNYTSKEDLRINEAIIKKYKKMIPMCRVNMRYGWYYGNVFVEDLLPKLDIDENGIQGNVTG